MSAALATRSSILSVISWLTLPKLVLPNGYLTTEAQRHRETDSFVLCASVSLWYSVR